MIIQTCQIPKQNREAEILFLFLYQFFLRKMTLYNIRGLGLGIHTVSLDFCFAVNSMGWFELKQRRHIRLGGHNYGFNTIL